MDNGIRISADAMVRMERKYDAVAHNSANMGTDYFKEVLLSYESDNNGTVKAVQSFSTEQGVLKPTTDRLTFALGEKNFLKALDPSGNLFYLKNGKLSISADGELMSGEYRILDSSSRGIGVESLEGFFVDESGYVSQDGALIGRLGIVEMENPTELKQDAPGVFSSEGMVEKETGFGALIKQGYSETSNVNRGRQVMNMITVLHSYEASQKALLVNDEAVGKAIYEVGRF